MFAVSDAALTLAAFAVVSSLVILIHLLTSGGRDAVERRLHTLANPTTAQPLAAVSGGTSSTFVFSPPKAEQAAIPAASRQAQPKNPHAARELRFIEAGLYTTRAVRVFNAVRLSLPVGMAIGIYLVCLALRCEPATRVLYGVFGGGFGLLLPNVYLVRAKRARQLKVRRALPDVLDVITICMQGGLSLGAALDQVVRELAVVHPMLSVELHIVQRQVQMGQSVGQSLREMAVRVDLEELRSMSGVIVQAERVGASLATALANFSRGLRLKRQQRAEEMAHTTGVKVLFPTLFLIFPVMFGIILGPAAIQVYHSLIQGGGIFHVPH